ncbi:nucleotidyltransferase domain-containing protein [Lachnospiraceae bacterium MD1]|uniref:Nucleotidyltransferase domain-containing protein n=1 Tax=Variimorphobacter saccharofermentans TaxID=2755051 RepID=A0A839JWE1_9FIRM|nr:LPD16 domain-containing protein [Variimorphobacter saccharofermentans]MBB2181760.1 nucleotidyltransferase domain-containing protein [Variimorphobacter saccharofermentans]
MQQEEMRETELAFRIADRIISIQECDDGYDYSIMDENYREIDGGVYDNPEISIREALKDIIEDLKQNPDTNGAKGNISMESELVLLDFDEVTMEEEEANRIGSAVYDSWVVMEFKAKTEQCFQPINALSATEIEEIVEEYVNAKLMENDFDASIRGVVLSGSRCRGLEGKNSDLDVVVELRGNEREDDLFNLFHEDKFSIGGIRVDINPITEYKTGTLEEYLPGVERYLEEKRQKISVREKLKEKKSEIQVKYEKVDKGSKKKNEKVR